MLKEAAVAVISETFPAPTYDPRNAIEEFLSVVEDNAWEALAAAQAYSPAYLGNIYVDARTGRDMEAKVHDEAFPFWKACEKLGEFIEVEVETFAGKRVTIEVS